MSARGKTGKGPGSAGPSSAAKPLATSASNIGETATRSAAAAAAPTWRHLPFYEASTVRDADDYARSPAVFRDAIKVNVVQSLSRCPAFAQKALGEAALEREAAKGANASSRPNVVTVRRGGFFVIGTNQGRIQVCDAEHFREIASFPAYGNRRDDEQGQVASSSTTRSTARVTHIAIDAQSKLYTLGEDHGVHFPILRIWDLRTAVSSEKQPSMPRLLGDIRVQHGSEPFPVSAIALTPSASFLAVGLGNGTVLLLRNLKDALSAVPKWQPGSNVFTPAIALPKFKVAHQSSSASDMSPVTALAFSEQGSVTAVSAAKDRAPARKGPQPRSSRPRKALIEAEPEVKEETSRQTTTSVQLFIVSIARVLRYTVLGKGAGSPAAVIDDVGCDLGCAAMLPARTLVSDEDDAAKTRADRLVVARDEAIYVIGQEGREMTLAFEGKKASVRLFKSQLVVISPPMSSAEASAGHDATLGRDHLNSARASTPTGRRQGGQQKGRDVAIVTVFDLDDKLIAFSALVDVGIREAWSDEIGDMYVLSDDGLLARFSEKPLRQKLDLLFHKSLYLLAVGVARSHVARSRTDKLIADQSNVDALLGDIYRRYGEYLYEKGDYEGAISQFTQTIGVTQPSYVIRKFLDAQRIKNLTTYLQELHARGYANSDHTTLLLNCYAKLKDVAALDRFIHKPVHNKKADAGSLLEHDDATSLDDDEKAKQADDLPFDLSTAINVCRQGGYYEHAAYLAKRHGRPDEYMRIQIEDRGDCAEAVNFIRTLSVDDAQRNLVRYGSRLLANDAKGTTDLLIELCSGAFQPVPIAVGAGVDASKLENKSAAAYLSYLQVGRLVKPAAGEQGSIKASVSSPALTADTDTAAFAPIVTPPSVEAFYPHFVDHKADFIRFLESVALARWGQHVDADGTGPSDGPLADPTKLDEEEESFEKDTIVAEQESLWNTLLELYVADKGPESLQKATSLLRQHRTLSYDIARALVCCVHDGFEEGALYLYERLGMYEDIVRQRIEAESLADEAKDATRATEAGEKVIHALDRFGPRMSDLYALVLEHLVAHEARIKRHEADVERILAHIFRQQLLSPLEIVQMLSKSEVAPVSLLRGHLLQVLQGQQADIATNKSLTSTYRAETLEKQRDIAALQDPQETRVFQQTRCSVCHGQLDLPSVHFMCRHSFHARCLGAGENECPNCAKSHATILEIRRNNVAFGQRHDLFIEEVEEAEDGFDVVANMFSKGLFDPQLLGTQQQATSRS